MYSIGAVSCSVVGAMMILRKRFPVGRSLFRRPHAVVDHISKAHYACRANTRLAMSVQSLGYVGIRAKSLGDWGDYGTKLLGLQRIDKSASSLAFRMDDRKQRIIVDQDGGAGHRLLRLGSRGRGRARCARREARSRRREGRARLARARRRAAREGPDRARGPARQPRRGFPRRRDRGRSVQARPLDLGLPHRPARHGPCRAASSRTPTR